MFANVDNKFYNLILHSVLWNQIVLRWRWPVSLAVTDIAWWFIRGRLGIACTGRIDAYSPIASHSLPPLNGNPIDGPDKNSAVVSWLATRLAANKSCIEDDALNGINHYGHGGGGQRREFGACSVCRAIGESQLTLSRCRQPTCTEWQYNSVLRSHLMQNQSPFDPELGTPKTIWCTHSILTHLLQSNCWRWQSENVYVSFNPISISFSQMLSTS